MATASVAVSHHGTLTASTVDTVTLTQPTGQIEVINRSGSAEIYFTVDGPAPTVTGDNTYVVPAGVMSYVVPLGSEESERIVSLISSGSPTYSVIGGQGR